MAYDVNRNSSDYGNGFKYFMNAMLYFMWIHKTWFYNTIKKMVFQAMRIPVKYLFPERFLRKFYRRFLDGQFQVKPIYEDKRDGAIILMAKQSLSMAWVFYACSIILLILGFVAPVYWPWARSHYLGETVTLVIFMLIASLPLVSVFLLSYSYLYTNGQYVDYFDIFEKESSQWYRKWKWITLSFCIGSILTFTLTAILLNLMDTASG